MEYRSIERCERQSHIFVSAQTPTDDPTRILVDDNCQIPPLPPELEIRNIAYPHPVRTIGNDIELAVGNASEERMAPRIGMIEFCRTCPQAVFRMLRSTRFFPTRLPCAFSAA